MTDYRPVSEIGHSLDPLQKEAYVESTLLPITVLHAHLRKELRMPSILPLPQITDHPG